MILKGRLTDDNIAKGRRLVCDECPYALAVRQAMPRGFVGVVRLGISYGTIGPVGFPIPIEIGRQIATYDAGGALQPHDFELDIPGMTETQALFWGTGSKKTTKKKGRRR